MELLSLDYSSQLAGWMAVKAGRPMLSREEYIQHTLVDREAKYGGVRRRGRMTPCCGEISKKSDRHAKRPSAGPESPHISASVSEDAGGWRMGCAGCCRTVCTRALC
jgi:hypothetical protein